MLGGGEIWSQKLALAPGHTWTHPHTHWCANLSPEERKEDNESKDTEEYASVTQIAWDSCVPPPAHSYSLATLGTFAPSYVSVHLQNLFWGKTFYLCWHIFKILPFGGNRKIITPSALAFSCNSIALIRVCLLVKMISCCCSFALLAHSLRFKVTAAHLLLITILL